MLAALAFKTFLVNAGAIIAALAGFVVIVFVAYRKVRDEIRKTGESQHNAIESAVKRLNGWIDSVLDALPYPAWIKVAKVKEDGTIEFRMQFINRAYEQWYGIQRQDYIGRTDYDVWPRDVAEKYFAHDCAVLNSKRGSVFDEPFTRNDGNVTGMMEFEKQYLERNGVQGVVGFVRPKALREDLNTTIDLFSTPPTPTEPSKESP